MVGGSRKVLIRVIGAPLLLAALGLILYADYAYRTNVALRLLLAGVAALSALEFYGLCAAKGIGTARAAGAACAAAVMAPWTWLAQKAGLGGIRADVATAAALVPAFLVVYVFLKLTFRRGAFTVEGAAFTVAGFAYVGLLRFLIHPPLMWPGDWYFLVFLLAANKGSDMAAYVAGKSAGRHKMAPVLSPNKTWEGAAAGAAAGTAAGGAVLLATPLRDHFAGIQAPLLLCLALVVTIASQVGDLAESALKRWAGVKDSGSLMPEFGGMLDMVDGFIISAPVAHVLTLALVA